MLPVESVVIGKVKPQAATTSSFHLPGKSLVWLARIERV
jgi:hypothetical protein